jgi:hypothetical protein
MLPGANLTGANLAVTRFNGAILTGADWPPDVKVPDGWQRDTESGRLKRAGTSSDESGD